MVRVIKKFLLVLGLLKKVDKWVGENKIVLFDPRINLDDQNVKFLR